MKRICSLAAVLLTLGIALGGCSGSDEPSSSNIDTSSGADVSAVDITEDELDRLGDRLRPIAELCAGKRYTLECTLTGTDIPDPIRIKRVVSGDDVYQLQTEKLGSHGFVSLSGVSYDFDYVCGMYREAKSVPELNIIEQIAANGLAVSKYRGSADSEDGKQYDVEEYIYTGGTFITRIDFYFEKADGRLVRYVTTYSVEGQDDIVETRTVERIDRNVDDSLFNAYFTDELSDFERMSEEQRQGFCQGLCGSYGITTEEMSELGIASSALKNIDYNTLFRLIYTYGKPHEPVVGDSSAAEDSTGSADDTESTESADNTESTESADNTESTDSTDNTDSMDSTDDTESADSAASADGSADDTDNKDESKDI